MATTARRYCCHHGSLGAVVSDSLPTSYDDVFLIDLICHMIIIVKQHQLLPKSTTLPIIVM